MAKAEYEIDPGKITSNSEETSAISNISYEIENANDNNLDNEKIRGQITKLKKGGNFPKNLDYIDSYTDPSTGTTATAFLNKDTGKVTVGMAGTNFHGDQLKRVALSSMSPLLFPPSKQDMKDVRGTMKDGIADLAIGVGMVNYKGKHFANTQQFIENLQKKYEIDTVTGHSLGGRDAIFLGLRYNIKNVVAYNPAPLEVKSIRNKFGGQLFRNTTFPDEKYLKELMDNYDGDITKVITQKDGLDYLVKRTDHLTCGDVLRINNGQGHAMENFLGEKEQREIIEELMLVKGYRDANDKAFKALKKNTEKKLGKIDEIKSKLLQTNGGALSSSQQKLLETLVAFSVAEGLSKMVDQELQQLKNMFNLMDEKFEANWKDAQEASDIVGKHLSYPEKVSALDNGGVNESKLATEPHNEIKDKLNKITDLSKKYNSYLQQIEKSINEIVAKDQQLAGQIGDLI